MNAARRILATALGALAFAAVHGVAQADDTPATSVAPDAPNAVPATKPPPGVAASKRLSDDDYARKKEGFYFTGLPLFSYDPDYGFGLGGRGYYYYDGGRSNALFPYTPYLHRIYVQVFASTGGEQEHLIDYDAPALPNANYRVRATLEYDAATDWPYFGIGSRSMRPLSFPGAPGVTFAKMSDYNTATSAVFPNGTTFARYNVYELRRPVLQLALERNLLGGVLRSMIGTNLSYAVINDYTGVSTATGEKDANGHTVYAPEARTLLATDCAAKRIVGCGGGWDNVLRLALSIDTRDFEPDPNSGVYAELSGEFGTALLGSQYQYMRLMLSVRGFYSPIPRVADLVIAARGVYEIQTTGTPFFTETLMPFIDDNHSGLGGFRTLRGYRQNRFVGPVMALTNYEVRWTFLKFHAVGQDFGLIAVPFLDMGVAFDDVEHTSLGGWARAQGMGVRIAWNEATIIMIDYGFSSEDSGLYLNFNHIF
jgi:surface antigen Omp85-like protein